MRNTRVNQTGSSTLCTGVRAQLLDYIDGELSPRERQAVLAHLEACVDCRQELALCQRAERALLSGASAIPAPGDLRASFYARLDANPSAQRARLGWRIAGPALAMGMGLLALALWLPVGLHRGGTTPEDVASGTTARPGDRFAGTDGTSRPPLAVGTERGAARHNSSDLGSMVAMATIEDGFYPYGLFGLDQPTNAGTRHRTKSTLGLRRRGRGDTHSVAPGDLAKRSTVRLTRSDSPTGSARSSYQSEAIDRDVRLYSRSEIDRVTRKLEMPAPVYAYTDQAGMGDVDSGVHLRVVDEVRGFTASARIADSIEDRNGDRVLTIDATEGASGETPPNLQN
jgi:hypothetical protein